MQGAKDIRGLILKQRKNLKNAALANEADFYGKFQYYI